MAKSVGGGESVHDRPAYLTKCQGNTAAKNLPPKNMAADSEIKFASSKNFDDATWSGMSFQLMNFQSQNFEVVDRSFAGDCHAGERRIHESLLESWLNHLVLPVSDEFAIVTEKKGNNYYYGHNQKLKDRNLQQSCIIHNNRQQYTVYGVTHSLELKNCYITYHIFHFDTNSTNRYTT